MADDWERVDTGAPDPDLMTIVRTVAEDYEPLVTASAFDDPINPEEVHLHLTDGVSADSGRFDVTWTNMGYYRYHYTEGDDLNYRYDRHPRVDLPDNHFHEPPDAAHDAVPSCIEVETVRLATLAVLQLWRETVETGELDLLQQPNPP